MTTLFVVGFGWWDAPIPFRQVESPDLFTVFDKDDLAVGMFGDDQREHVFDVEGGIGLRFDVAVTEFEIIATAP